MTRSLFFSLCLLSVSFCFAEPVRVSVTDFGAEPNSKKDCVEAVRKALDACKDRESTVLVFPKGRYDFYQPEDGKRIYGMTLHQRKNLTVDGQGSEFIFHGIMGVADVNRSENLTLKNFSVDWDRPMIVQGNIVDTKDDWVDIRFDMKEYPFEIEDGKIQFLGEGWKRNINGYTLLFDKKTKELVYRTRDSALGGNNLFNDKSEHLGDGVVRFHGKPKMKPEPGTYIALWLGRYTQVAFSLNNSKDVTLENIDVYHALSHGVVGFKTENITLRKVDYKLNEKKDRVFTLVADGYHLNTCKGLVTIENCTQVGMGDDFLNLHGMNVMIENRVDDYTVAVRIEGRGSAHYTLGVGDEVWFVDGENVQRGPVGRIKDIKTINDNGRDGGKMTAKHIIFEEKVPEGIKHKDALENKTWNAELEMRGCKVLRQHRARGILVTTPLRAVIENNLFRTAGTAILIEGDVNYWFESGGVRDLVIRNNTFEDCFSSGFAGDWGHAVITIHPSFKPRSDTDEPYHRNIRIENNTFKTFDYPVLFARSVGDLKFTGNKLQRTKTYEPFAVNKATYWLDGCRNVLIDGNSYADDILGKNVKTFHMKPGDMTVKDKEIVIE